MTITTIQLLAALAELIRQGGLLALVVIEGWIIFKLWQSRDALYDRLITSKEEDAKASIKMTTTVVTALTKATAITERIEQRKYGLLTDDAGLEEEEPDETLEDEEEQD